LFFIGETEICLAKGSKAKQVRKYRTTWFALQAPNFTTISLINFPCQYFDELLYLSKKLQEKLMIFRQNFDLTKNKQLTAC